MITYADTCSDPNLFGPWFEGDSWNTWRMLDKALFGLPLAGPELETFRGFSAQYARAKRP